VKITELVKKLEEVIESVESLDADLHHATDNINDAINNNNNLDTVLNTILKKLLETQTNMEVK
tara:strand:+ start:1792 stop:1980 length:189 start_codon:yes stop_codon:yes gene_type:complete